MKKRIASSILIAAMSASLVTVPAFAVDGATLNDIQGHTAESVIKSWVEYGVLRGGNDGKFHPDSTLTRAQMAAILNRMIGYQEKSENSFNDLAAGAWYTDDMLCLAGASVLKGSGEVMRPDAAITYQEAVVMIARALELKGTDKIPKYEDYAEVAAWAKESVNALAECGALKDRGTRLRPQANITRAETLQILDRLVGNFVNTSGTYSKITEGNLLVNAKDVTLKDMTVTGDLIVADGVADGDVYLDNVKVEGEVILRGCGANSFHILPGTEVKSVTVTKTASGVIRLVNESGETIPMVFVNDGKSGVTIEGKFESVDVKCDAPVAFGSGEVGSINVLTPNADVTIAKDTSVSYVNVNAAASDSKLNIAGNVKDLAVSAPGKITNNGKVTNVAADVEGVQWDGNKPAYVDPSAKSKPVGTDGKEITGSVGSGLSEGSGLDIRVMLSELTISLASPAVGARAESGLLPNANTMERYFTREVEWQNEDGTPATLSPEGAFLAGKTYVASVKFTLAYNAGYSIDFNQAPSTYVKLTDKNTGTADTVAPTMKLEKFEYPWKTVTVALTYPATEAPEAKPEIPAQDLKIVWDVRIEQGGTPMGGNSFQRLFSGVYANKYPGATCQWYKTTAADVECTQGTMIPGATYSEYDGYSTAEVGEQYFYCVYTYNGREYTSELGKVSVIDMPCLDLKEPELTVHSDSYSLYITAQEETVIPGHTYTAKIALKGTFVGETEVQELSAWESGTCFDNENKTPIFWDAISTNGKGGLPASGQKLIGTITELVVTVESKTHGAEFGDTVTLPVNISYEYPDTYGDIDTAVSHGTFRANFSANEGRLELEAADAGARTYMLRPANANTVLAKLDQSDPLALADTRGPAVWTQGDVLDLYWGNQAFQDILQDSENGCAYLAVNSVTLEKNSDGSYCYKVGPTRFVDVILE